MIALLLLLLMSCGFVDDHAGGVNPPATGEESEALYTCPMHPEILQEDPGSCPICGMDLVPASGQTGGSGITIDPVVRQNMNLRTDLVQRTTLHRRLRTLGEVDVGEDELAVVNNRFSGWAERVYVERTGDQVSRGQVLFEIYSPELVSAQEELLLARRTEGPDSALARSTRRKLELWGLAEADIDALLDRGEPSRTWPIRAPQSGFVLHKDVVEGSRVQAGQDLYRIGNLRRIWVTAEVYEHDAPWVEEGQPAQMELSYQRGQVLEGKVAHIYPTLNPVSRTLRVRLEFDNPGVRLKPGMFATVTIQHRERDGVIAVPSEAILRSGHRQVVFVHAGDGTFEAREVVTGLVGAERRTEILSGLEEGEEVVVSGQFLVDSESQLQEAIDKLSRPPQAHDHDHDHDHDTPSVRDEAEPGQYVCPMHCDDLVFDEPGRCPVCGMFLEEVKADTP